MRGRKKMARKSAGINRPKGIMADARTTNTKKKKKNNLRSKRKG